VKPRRGTFAEGIRTGPPGLVRPDEAGLIAYRRATSGARPTSVSAGSSLRPMPRVRIQRCWPLVSWNPDLADDALWERLHATPCWGP
jgi:hypothetical protein